MSARFCLLLSLLVCLLAGCATPVAPTASGPVDWRHRIESSVWQKVGDGEWATPLVRAAFPFEELIYSWHVHQPGDTFRLYLKAVFAPGDETDWLYAGYWGAVSGLIAKREAPTFDRGVLDLDWLKLKAKATGFRFMVVNGGAQPLQVPPSLTVIATDNHPPAMQQASRVGMPAPRVFDVPLRRQFDSQGRRLIDRCQSAALASAMEYYGKSVPMEQIVRHTFDPEYDYPGIWPRVIGAAQEFGFEGYIERFRTWAEVRRALAENKIILCSMRMKAGACEAPPYPSMGNHIVALCGVTGDGRVVVTDSFLGRSGRGYLCQWRQTDFETVWMRTKGGVAMVICPPASAVERRVKDLPPFPKDRAFTSEDDH